MKRPSEIHDYTFESLSSTYHKSWRPDLGFAVRSDKLTHGIEGAAANYRDFFGICIVLGGSGTHLIDSIPYSIVRGDVFVILPGTMHAWLEVNNLDLIMAHFTIRGLTRTEMAALTNEPGFQSLFLKYSPPGSRGGRWLRLEPALQDWLTTIVAELTAEVAADTLTTRIIAHGLFFRMLAVLSRIAGDQTRVDARVRAVVTDNRLMQALKFLDENFTEHVKLDDAAAAACLSPSHFTRLFTAEIGCTPRDYLRHLRLERAKGLLAATEKPIGWISHESGFSEPPYFARVFRNATGMTPRAYRRTAGRSSTAPRAAAD